MKEKRTNKPSINPPVSTSIKSKKPALKNESRLKIYILPVTVLIAICISWCYNQWLASRVNTPLHKPRVINESVYKSTQNLDRYWGTYRSNLYFGLKTRSSNPFSVGMMWFNQYNPNFEIRHWCDQNDGLKKYGWTAHDGRNFGIHDLIEKDYAFQIQNAWVKRHGGLDGGDWTVRTKVTPTNSDSTAPSLVSIVFYFSAEDSGWIKTVKKLKRSSILEGETSDLGKFKIKIELNQNDKPFFFDYTSGNSTVAHIKENLIQNRHFVRIESGSKEIPQYIGMRAISDLDGSNFIAYQVTGHAPFEFEVVFESQSLRDELISQNLPSPKELKGSEFDRVLSDWNKKFEKKFQTLFRFEEKNFSSSAVKMAQATLSNLLGGIGFFSGQSIVQSLNNKEPVLYWNANLYTAVPSRSFFPRGFLWDEGFHNILISQWDLEITKDIIGHWLDLMNTEGWIPREVILGEEARAKVPKEFWIQNSNYANPPTLFLPLDQLINQVNEIITKSETVSNAEYAYLNHIYDRLTHWYDWFNKTQVGKLPFTYRWRGRVVDSLTELNPKTLTSGLDDYPRASHPTDQERHLDLRCWIALSSKVMGNLYEIIKKDAKTTTNIYKEHYITLKNNKLLDELHWSNKQYADYGLHSDQIRLVRQRPSKEQMHINPNSLPMIRDVQVEPTNQYINSIGYVSLFPMLLELLDAESPKLGIVLDQLRDPKELWTPFGLRSLSKSAPLYDKRNTEHDPPYWRSPIWVNVNYLALKSLKHYSSIDGPHKEKAQKIYGELRFNLINNILKNYERTGYIWENYNDKNGNGQGSHPFTGWSSLVVLIMAEVY